jgi:hypothetical protein
MPIVLDGKALEPTLIEMPMSHRVVGVLPSLRVGQRQPAEKAGQFAVPLWPEYHVPVVGHHEPVKDADRLPFVGQRHHLFKGEEILVLLEQPQPAVGAVQDMIDQSSRSDTGDARHWGSITAKYADVKGRVTFSSPHGELGIE